MKFSELNKRGNLYSVEKKECLIEVKEEDLKIRFKVISDKEIVFPETVSGREKSGAAVPSGNILDSVNAILSANVLYANFVIL